LPVWCPPPVPAPAPVVLLTVCGVVLKVAATAPCGPLPVAHSIHLHWVSAVTLPVDHVSPVHGVSHGIKKVLALSGLRRGVALKAG
jgi:hypothetical protein